jgi:hypothetical protein
MDSSARGAQQKHFQSLVAPLKDEESYLIEFVNYLLPHKHGTFRDFLRQGRSAPRILQQCAFREPARRFALRRCPARFSCRPPRTKGLR